MVEIYQSCLPLLPVVQLYHITGAEGVTPMCRPGATREDVFPGLS